MNTAMHDNSAEASSSAEALDDRQDALERAQNILGAHAPVEQLLRTAEFLLHGPVLLDPDRVENAARALARTQGINWPCSEPQVANELLGAALQTITGYQRG